MPPPISRYLRLSLVFVVLAALAPLARPAAAATSGQKLVILGFDGVDAKLTARWMDEGKLPNLAKLRAQGSFSPLLPTIPSQTPVSWSTFSTGLNPGRHGVFDFLKRDPKTYRPTFAAAEEGKAPFLFGENNGLYGGAIAGVAVPLLLLLLLKLFRLRTAVAGPPAVVLGRAAGAGAAAPAVRPP